jgi:hypothetical protein
MNACALTCDFVDRIVHHIGSDFTVHMLVELFDEYDSADHAKLMKYLGDQNLIPKLFTRFLTSSSMEMTNISIVVLSLLERFNLSGMQQLVDQLMAKEVLVPLFAAAVSEACDNRKQILQMFFHLSIHASIDKPPVFLTEAKSVIAPFAAFLKQQPTQISENETNEAPQLGPVRLLVVKILVLLISTGDQQIVQEVLHANIMPTFMDMFYAYKNNNLLHNGVAESIQTIFRADRSEFTQLQTQVLVDCDIINRSRAHIQAFKDKHPHPSNLGHSIALLHMFETLASTNAQVKNAL